MIAKWPSHFPDETTVCLGISLFLVLVSEDGVAVNFFVVTVSIKKKKKLSQFILSINYSGGSLFEEEV